VLVDKINDGYKDAEPFAISNLTIAQRDWFKDADLLDEHLQSIFITLKRNVD